MRAYFLRSRAFKDFITSFLSENVSKFKHDFDCLTPSQRIRIYIKLLEFVIPRMKLIDANIEAEYNSTISLHRFINLPVHERIEVLNKIDFDNLNENI